jgi:hypothetical protein
MYKYLYYLYQYKSKYIQYLFHRFLKYRVHFLLPLW